VPSFPNDLSPSNVHSVDCAGASAEYPCIQKLIVDSPDQRGMAQIERDEIGGIADFNPSASPGCLRASR